MKKSLSLLLSFSLMLIFAGLFPTPARAETQDRFAAPEGTNSGDCTIITPCSLQRAVTLSNSAAEGVETTIYLKSGTYVADTSMWYPEVIRVTNSVNLIGRCDFSTGSPICAPENDATTLSGETVRRIMMLQLSSAEVIHLFNLNLVYGIGNEQSASECPDAGTGDPTGCGGAIYAISGANDENELKIENCVFQYNYGSLNTYPTSGEQGLGGAITLSNFGAVKISNSTFDRNTAVLDGYGYGGAIYSSNNQNIIQNSVFTRNRCTVYAKIGEGCGLQIHNGEGLTEISDNIFELNNTNTTPADDKRRLGGAISLSANEQLKVTGNFLAQNAGESALYIHFLEGSSENLIAQNQLRANFTDYAMDLQYSVVGPAQASVDVLHNFVSYQWGYDEDEVTTRGVRIESDTSNRLLVNFWHNSLACLDMGLHIIDYVNIDITNNIIGWTTEAADAYTHYPPSGPEVTGSTNLTYFANLVDLPDEDHVNADPKFKDMIAGDLHILKTSPAIDLGVDLGMVTDVDGEIRPIGLPDVGADEFVAWQYLPHLLR